ncbi:LacI family DNA-binding transcriptional regulator [Gulosibacter molinativorax]|uniref:LacI family transcriptional regulator n=1 Tax=Gulosibacter molinativorax TaxID=256821 RepID=A0ABT7CBK2_9MICO|nr:LacI family DNA-binding transcriptional regulator [Gulosibacter molinativorax]MDJ1372542.1 LacI family transcriptional regulator [Gulosibacter molinativorax]QUY62605.1 Catabolite control protein A [Gulosibacter molinativorax]
MTIDADAGNGGVARRSAVTLQDVADRAGVSRSAASFALTDRGRVSEATRKRVKDAAAELGYRPNRAARNLRTQRTGIIGLCLPKGSTIREYYMALAFGAVDVARDEGLLVAIISEQYPASTLLDFDGLLVLDPQQDDDMIRAAETMGIPVVTGERPLQDSAAVRGIVHGNHRETFPQLLDHLELQGSQVPALIAPVGSTDWASSARAAYLEWCADRGLEPRAYETSFPGTAEEVQALAIELVEDRSIDAIISMTDGTVIDVLTAALGAGREPGRDLLIASASDASILQYTEPRITSLDLHPREFGASLVRLLHRVLLEKPEDVIVELSPVDLIVRASTATPLPARQ